MAYSCSTSLFGELPIEQIAERLAMAGFSQVEIFDRARTDDWLDDIDRARRALQANGLCVRTVHVPVIGWEIDSRDELLRDIALQACARSMARAAELGAEVAICHPNGAHLGFTVEDYGPGWQRTCQSLAWLAERAKETGISLAVENLPAHFTPRPGMLVQELLRMIEGLGDHVGICLDVGHSTANSVSAAEETRQAGDKLLALHIQDNDGSGADLHWLPGDGVTDWPAFWRALDEMDFQSIRRTFEVGRGQDLDETLRRLAALRDGLQGG